MSCVREDPRARGARCVSSATSSVSSSSTRDVRCFFVADVAETPVAFSHSWTACSTVYTDGVSSFRPWAVRSRCNRRLSRGSRWRSTSCLSESRVTASDAVPGSTCSSAANSPSVIPGCLPMQRSMRRCCAVIPKRFSIEWDTRSRARSSRHRHRRKSSAGPNWCFERASSFGIERRSLLDSDNR